MTDDVIRVPIVARYKKIDGRMVMVEAEYADISADAVARFLMDRLHVPYKRKEEEDEQRLS